MYVCMFAGSSKGKKRPQSNRRSPRSSDDIPSLQPDVALATTQRRRMHTEVRSASKVAYGRGSAMPVAYGESWKQASKDTNFGQDYPVSWFSNGTFKKDCGYL